MSRELVTIARDWLHVREAAGAANKGLRVEAIQHYSGGSFGDEWCVEMAWLWFDLATSGNVPFARGLNSEALHVLAHQKGWIVSEPARGDIVLSIRNGVAHHTAICTVPRPLVTIAGNTSVDGQSSTGDRVAEHVVSPVDKVFVRVPILT